MTKKLLLAASAAVAAAVLFIGGGGWYFADQIKASALAVDHSEDPPDLEVADVSGGYLTLRILPGTRTTEWRTDGVWGVDWKNGWAQAGGIVEMEDRSAVREYTPVTGSLRAGDKVQLSPTAFAGDPLQAHGIAFDDVSYSSELGSFPAWYIDGPGDVWAIFVHGRNNNRREALRMLPVIAEQGLPSLVITYRNDEGTPPNPDGLNWFGLTEWKDLEGAVKYAMDNGAEGVVLVGYSMGGSIVTSFLYESPLAEKVKGVILDSPMLDFSATVTHGAAQRKMPVIGTPIPGAIVWSARTLSSVRFGIDYDRLDYLSRATKLSAPVLLFHGDADKTVPVGTSDALAKARPDIVRYIRTPGAGHVRSWNAVRDEYEAAVEAFLLETVK